MHIPTRGAKTDLTVGGGYPTVRKFRDNERRTSGSSDERSREDATVGRRAFLAVVGGATASIASWNAIEPSSAATTGGYGMDGYGANDYGS